MGCCQVIAIPDDQPTLILAPPTLEVSGNPLSVGVPILAGAMNKELSE